MIKKITNLVKYKTHIDSFFKDECFSNPMLTTDEQIECNLYNAINKDNRIVLGVFSGDEKIIGIFVFLLEKSEKYLEMIVGLAREQEAYVEILQYLTNNYHKYECDFVFNPQNYLLINELKKYNTKFEKEQVKLKLTNFIDYKTTLDVELLSEKYYQQYIGIHNKLMYWTGDKVIKSQNKFKTFIAINNDKVVGYIDFTHCFAENEPYDLFVLPEYRGQKYGKTLLAKAIEENKPKNMMVLIEVDNIFAINLYKSLGFSIIKGESNLTAHCFIN